MNENLWPAFQCASPKSGYNAVIMQSPHLNHKSCWALKRVAKKKNISNLCIYWDFFCSLNWYKWKKNAFQFFPGGAMKVFGWPIQNLLQEGKISNLLNLLAAGLLFKLQVVSHENMKSVKILAQLCCIFALCSIYSCATFLFKPLFIDFM